MEAQTIQEQQYSSIGWNRKGLLPDWSAQRIRCVLPCQNVSDYEWLRAGPVVTLGELFKHLGTEYTAREIYAFYRTCRVVVLKRKKDAARPKGKSGSASASAGSSIVTT